MMDVSTPLLPVLTLLACIAAVHLLRLPALVADRGDRLASIDGLRGVLAVAVFFHHFYISYRFKLTGAWVAPTSAVYNLFGTAGVTLFFMVTGFLFFGKIKAVRGKIDLNRFYAGRVFRIVPIYALSVVLVYSGTFMMTGFKMNPPLSESLDQWIFFRAAPINRYPFSPLINAGVVWTLDYEWIFYFAIPVIAYIWQRLKLQAWVLALAAVIALYYRRNGVLIPGLDLDSGLFAPFVLGGMAGELGRITAIRRFVRGPFGAVLSIVAATLLFGAFSTVYSVSGYLVLFAFFVPIALGNSIFGFLHLRAVVFLGEVSYDVYMLHGIVLFLLFTVLMPDALQNAHSLGRMWSLMLIATAAVVLASLAAHLAVERPMVRLGRRITPIDEVQQLAAP